MNRSASTQMTPLPCQAGEDEIEGDSSDEATGPGSLRVPVLKCIYCKAQIYFSGWPAIRYQDHLFREHNILYGKTDVVKNTLELQGGGSSIPKKSDAKAKLVSSSCQTDPVSVLNPLVKLSRKPSVISLQSSLHVKDTVRASMDPESVEPVEAEKGKVEGERCLVSVTKKINWFEGCEYQCQVCMEMFFNSDEIRLHIKSVHSMSSNAYIDRFERLESKPAEIHCFLCDHEMKRNIFAINKHLEACHDMDVLKYGRKFKLRQHEITFQQYEGQEVKKKQPEIKKIAQSVVSPPLERKRIRPCPASKKSSSSDVQSPEDPLPPKKSRISTTSKKWYHGTEYKCQICLEVHYSSSALISHLTASHQMDSQVYRIKYGRFATMTVYYSCKICGNGVIHLQDTIARHLKDDHNMELTVYEMIYEPFETSGEKPRSRKGGAKKNSDTLDDNDSSSDIGDSISAVAAKSYELQQAEEDGVGGHMSSHNNIDMEYEEDVKPDVEQLHSSAGKDLSLEQFMRGTCKFQCNLCKFETTVHSLFWEHVSNDHNMETEIYKDLHGKAYIKKSSKIECIVCYKHILHEPGAWSAHCRKTHGLDLFQFHEQYYSQVQQAADTVEDSPPAGRAPDGGDGGGSKAFNEWWNSGEKFDCQLCGKEQSTQKLLLRHIRGHGYSPDAYLEEFVKFQTRERTFSCQICRTDMSFNKTTVLLHLQKHSHRKPQDYFKMFINNGGKEEVKSCNVVGEGREVEEVVEAGKEDDGSSGGVLVPQTDHEDVLFIGRRSSITNSSASVVGKPKKKKVGRPPGSYTAVAPTKFDWEQGQRRCHLCPEMLGSIKAVHLHLKMKHPHSPTKRPKDLEESIQTHACLICEKMINFERIAVQQHLLGNHGMTLLEYEDKFQEGLKQIFSDLGVQY